MKRRRVEIAAAVTVLAGSLALAWHPAQAATGLPAFPGAGGL